EAVNLHGDHRINGSGELGGRCAIDHNHRDGHDRYDHHHPGNGHRHRHGHGHDRDHRHRNRHHGYRNNQLRYAWHRHYRYRNDRNHHDRHGHHRNRHGQHRNDHRYDGPGLHDDREQRQRRFVRSRGRARL
ncbi:MAG: hypothetical protein AVDCRST_MAG31-2232, partial [uncultured Sphingomonas sp.]